MKRVLFVVVMIGVMDIGSLVYAAQEKQPSIPAQDQVESIDEEVKEQGSKPSGEQKNVSAREQEMVRVLSGFKDSDGQNFPNDVARLAGEYDSDYSHLWLNPKARIKHKKLDGYFSIAINRDYTFAVTGLENGAVGIWDQISERPPRWLKGHPDAVMGIVISGDGRWVLTRSKDKVVRIWNAQTGELKHELKHRAVVSAMVISDGGRWVVTTSGDDKVRIWDMQTGKLVHGLKHDGNVELIVISADGKWVVVATAFGKTALIWNTHTGELMRELKHDKAVWSMVISVDGEWVVTGSADKMLRIWNRETGELAHELRQDSAVNNVAISGNGRWVVTTGFRDRIVRIWDSQDGALVHELKHNVIVTAATISLDGKWVITAPENRMVRMWDRESGRLVHELPLQYPGTFNKVMITDDNRWVIASTISNNTWIWWAELPTYEEINRALEEARAYIDGVLSKAGEIDHFNESAYENILEYRDRLNNLDMSRPDYLEAIEKIKERVRELFEQEKEWAVIAFYTPKEQDDSTDEGE